MSACYGHRCYRLGQIRVKVQEKLPLFGVATNISPRSSENLILNSACKAKKKSSTLQVMFALFRFFCLSSFFETYFPVFRFYQLPFILTYLPNYSGCLQLTSSGFQPTFRFGYLFPVFTTSFPVFSTSFQSNLLT